MSKKNINDSVVVSVCFTEGKPGVLVVGHLKKHGEGFDVINAFDGEEAKKLWSMLTIKKGEPRCL